MNTKVTRELVRVQILMDWVWGGAETVPHGHPHEADAAALSPTPSSKVVWAMTEPTVIIPRD